MSDQPKPTTGGDAKCDPSMTQPKNTTQREMKSGNVAPTVQSAGATTTGEWRFEMASGILDSNNRYVGAYGRQLVDAHNAALAAEREKAKAAWQQLAARDAFGKRVEKTIQQLRSQLAAAQAAMVQIRDHVKGNGERSPSLWCAKEMLDAALKGDTTALDATILEAVSKRDKRLLDLVRYCRSELHQAKLITNDEYARLVETGSESARRLEDYEHAIAAATYAVKIAKIEEYQECRKQLEASQKYAELLEQGRRDAIAVAQQPLVDALEYITNFGGDCFHHDEVVKRAKAALANIGKHGTE